MLERRADRLVLLTAAVFFLYLPLEWGMSRWWFVDYQRTWKMNYPAPWWSNSGAPVFAKTIRDRSIDEHLQVARLFMWGAGSLIPLCGCLTAILTGKRRCLWLGTILYALLALFLAGELAVRAVARSYASTTTRFQDGPVMYLIGIALGLLAIPWFLALLARAFRRIDEIQAAYAGRERQPVFGRAAIVGTGYLMIGLGFFSVLRACILPRRDISQFVHPTQLTDLAWSGFVGIAWGGLAIWMGRRVIRRPALVTQSTTRLAVLAMIALVGVYGLDYLFGVTFFDPSSRQRHELMAAQMAAPWVGCFLATCVLLWYWRPVIRGREAIDWADFEQTCVRCGYDLTGNESGVCSECGAKVARPEGAQTDGSVSDAAKRQ